MKKYFYLLLSVMFIFLINIEVNAQTDYKTMVQSMQIDDIGDLSISDDNSTMTFMQLAENYAKIVTDKNATPEQLEALGNIIKMWMDTLSSNFSNDQIFNEYSKVTSTLSCMSIHLVLRIAIKDNNIPTEKEQKNIYESIYNKFIPSFAQFKNDGWKTEFNFYVINMSAAVCKWYEDKSQKLDYPDFKVWRDGDF
ncbi:hypothetical protein [Brachyspira alvinipulli]|uniref:hypothetical protein n=1 Tax=Brachyspira alvinipulli TaxID=84379 RepID=UPI000488FD9E|nr:hypothetical protein [Brachyspira alvinipulli]